MADRQTDVLVVGGGLIGLSTAMHLLEINPRVTLTLIDKDEDVGAQQSGHNSGVIHAGIYYEPGSLKARFCVEGSRTLMRFCERHDIPVDVCGKVIVANTEEEIDRLERLYERGTDNGVPDLAVLSTRELRAIEPNVRGTRALHSPQTAIVDYRKVAHAYASVLRSAGGEILLRTAFRSAVTDAGRCRVETSEGQEIDAALVINCAGLHSDLVAGKMGARLGLRIIPFRGEYYVLRSECNDLVRGLVYPVPNPELPFLDVHLTKTMKNSVEVGPNAVLATRREGYRWRDFSATEFASTLTWGGFWLLAARHLGPGIAEINRSLRKSVFLESARKLVPDLVLDDLVSGGAGVRAQAVDTRGRLIDDFRIEESPGAIHVLNAPSPAATSSLMIGKYLASLADQRLSTV